MNQIFIEIPDPSMTQVKGQGPKFISTRPPTLDGLEIKVSLQLILYLWKPENSEVARYIKELEKRAEAQGMKVIREFDRENRCFNYRFV